MKKIRNNENNMRILAVTAVMALFTTLGFSQEGQISLQQDDKISDLLAIYKSANKSNEYYRIQVGFGSFDKAQEIKENVEIDFPDLFSKIDFDSPTYRVRLGKFKNKLEAERNLRRFG